MDIKELTRLLVTSSENFNQTRYIPWWEEAYGASENRTFQYNILEEDVILGADACVTKCTKEELLAPVGAVGLTLFHLLVLHNFRDLVEKLLCDGKVTAREADMPDHRGHGLTPFLLACACGNLAMVNLLKAHGASDSACDERGMNAYHFLAYPRFEQLSISFTCLDKSVEQRAEIARLLTCDIHKKNEKGFTPLEHLLSTEYSSSYTWPLTEVFLEKGAGTDYVDQEGNTLLMMALKNRHQTAALQLMAHCPDMLDTPDGKGVTPARHAVDYQNHGMFLALTGHGAAAVPNQLMQNFSLAQIAHRAFCEIMSDDRDAMSLALYLAERLVRQTDPDDDDDMCELKSIFRSSLAHDGSCHVLELCRDGGIDFTASFEDCGDFVCLRDECLECGHGVTVIKKLLEFGVDMDTAITYGKTPANIIASLDKGSDLDEKIFFEEAAKLLSTESMEQTDKRGMAAIHHAAKNGHTGMIKVMLERGVDKNLAADVPAEPGTTPLHLACMYGHADIVRLLIAAGADDTAKTLKGETPAHAVLLNKKAGRKLETAQIAEILKELKNLDVAADDGKTPLLLLGSQLENLLPIFLEKGVNVNHQDHNGMTAMMLYPDKDTIKELIRAGADIHLADKNGDTVLHHALENFHTSAARYLIKKGADYNRPDNMGKTPVQIAVEIGADSVLELMTDIR